MSDDPGRGLSRRQLLTRGGVAGASTIAAASGYVAVREISGTGDDGASGQASASAPEAPGPLFALDRGYANLTTFLLAGHPRPVREAIERHRHALDRDAALYLRKSEVALEEAARAAAAGYLGAEPDHVALTDSTTMGIALVYARLRLGPGEEVVTSEHDFFATHETLRLRQELNGVTVRRIRLYGEPEAASVDEIVSASRAPSRPGLAASRSHGCTRRAA